MTEVGSPGSTVVYQAIVQQIEDEERNIPSGEILRSHQGLLQGSPAFVVECQEILPQAEVEVQNIPFREALARNCL